VALRIRKNPSPTDSLSFPGGQPGSIAPTAGAYVTVGKALQLLEKFEALEPWVPALAGTVNAVIGNSPSRSH